MNMKKIIITESQLNRLKNVLNEESIQSSVVRQMKEFLDMNYAPVEKFMREGGEYYETPMIEIKADGEVISPKSLYEYLKYKYNMGEEFTKQVIRDWMYGNINDEHMLSKNVSLNEAKKDSFAEFAETRLKGATKITNTAKEKGGPSMLTYHHFKVKLPYYKKASEGKFDIAEAKKEFESKLSDLCKLNEDVKMDQVEFQKLVGLIEVLGELIIKKGT